MNGALLVILVMLGRLQDFLRAYPLGDAPSDNVVAQFMAKLDRLRALVAQQREGESLVRRRMGSTGSCAGGSPRGRCVTWPASPWRSRRSSPRWRRRCSSRCAG